jgi:hypothetical protein
MITIQIEMVTNPMDGSSRAQSENKGPLPSYLNIEARGISSPAEFARFREFISNTEVLFDKELKTLPG